MTEPALQPDIFIDGTAVRFNVQRVFHVFHFIYREEPVVDRHPRHFDGQSGREFPARRAGSENVEEPESLDIFRFKELLHEIFRVGDGGCGRIRNTVRRHDLHDIFLGSLLETAHGRGGRPCAVRRS